MKIRLGVFAGVLGAGLLAASAANASYIVNINQAGSNVVATGTGTIDLTGLTSTGMAGPSISQMAPAGGFLATGTNGSTPDVYTGFTGPSAFGPGSTTDASSGSGDYVGIADFVDLLAVPEGYVSGDALSSSATFDGQTLASLGITPGSYTWTWGDDGSFTIDASTSPVPEPSSLPLLLAGLAMIGGAMYFGRRKATTRI